MIRKPSSLRSTMLVHAKAPRIDVRIKGRGFRRVVDLIRHAYPNVSIVRDDESVNITETEWYRRVSPKLTPGKALKVYRDNAGLTLAALSAMTGIAESHLSAMEHDKRGI